MIVTIDGPAGAGKSSVARTLARRLGFKFLDTGAMYRAVTYAALHSQVELDDALALAELARHLELRMEGQQIWWDGEEITAAIRSPQVTREVGRVADHPAVRARLVQWQRELAAGGDIVTEGRDQGTVVFPDAECKIYLTATAEERARRRTSQLGEQGMRVAYETILREQQQRDCRDAARPVGRLTEAADAVRVETDGLSLEQVVNRLERIVEQTRRRLPGCPPRPHSAGGCSASPATDRSLPSRDGDSASGS